MKKKILLLMGIFTIGISNAQVGINTKNPLKIFHIDPAGNTNTTGTVGYTDDIIVNDKGYVGIGTLNPTTHLHIDKGTAASFLRIEDTSEGTGDKFLLSDASGNGTWIPRVKLSGKVYGMTLPSQATLYYAQNTDNRVLFNKVKSDTGILSNNTDNGYIRIDTDGSYIFTVRWWGSASSPAGSANRKYVVIPAVLKLKKVVGGVVQAANIDTFNLFVNVIGGARPRFAFTTSLFAPNLKKGELLSIIIQPLSTIWILGDGLSAPTGQFDNVVYFPSVMVYNI